MERPGIVRKAASPRVPANPPPGWDEARRALDERLKIDISESGCRKLGTLQQIVEHLIRKLQ